MHIIFTILICLLSLQAQDTYFDGISSMHSGYNRNGKRLSSNTPSLSQSLILDMPSHNFWSELTAFSEIKNRPASLSEFTLNTGKYFYENFYSVSIIFYSPDLNALEPELAINADLQTKLPISLSLKYLNSSRALYQSIGFFYEKSLSIPLYFYLKAGNHSIRHDPFSPDLEAALSSFFSLGNYALEPYVIVSWLSHVKRVNWSLNMSFSYNLRRL